MYVALEKYVAYDHDKEWATWEAGIDTIEKAVKPITGITTEVHVPPLGNHTPTLKITWDRSIVKISNKDFREALRNSEPSIEVGGGGENNINVTVFMLKSGQEKIVASRLKEVFTKATA
jgi:L-seryl-tRNA(Ser) seleniumtransferase